MEEEKKSANFDKGPNIWYPTVYMYGFWSTQITTLLSIYPSFWRGTVLHKNLRIDQKSSKMTAE